jgi:hypothetical protein
LYSFFFCKLMIIYVKIFLVNWDNEHIYIWKKMVSIFLSITKTNGFCLFFRQMWLPVNSIFFRLGYLFSAKATPPRKIWGRYFGIFEITKIILSSKSCFFFDRFGRTNCRPPLIKIIIQRFLCYFMFFSFFLTTKSPIFCQK